MPPKPAILANPGNARINADKNTALMIAARDGNLARVQEILAALPGHKAHKLDLANNYGWRAIHFAAQNGSVEILNAIIDATPEPKINMINITTKKTSTPLAIAIYYEKLPIVHRLLELGADVNIGGPKSTPLGLAFGVIKLHDNVAKIIWDAAIALVRANIDVKGFVYTADGKTIRMGLNDIILKLIEPGPDPNMPAKALELISLLIEKYPADMAKFVNNVNVVWAILDTYYITDIFAQKISVPLMRLLLDNGMKIISEGSIYGNKQPDSKNPILKAHDGRYSPEMNAFLKERFPHRFQKKRPITLAYPQVDLKQLIDSHYQYINQLSEVQQFTLSQYTYHGDVMMNAMLRGTDTIQTYRNNILSSAEAPGETMKHQLTCLFLYLLAPQLAENNYLKISLPGIKRLFYYRLNDNSRPEEKFYNRWNIPDDKQNFRKDVTIQELKNYKNTILDTYRDSVYPQLKARLDAGDLAYFRRLTYDAFKIIFHAIHPTSALLRLNPDSPPRIVYRGVSDFYIPKTGRIIIMNSFTSTTFVEDKSYLFYYGEPTGGIYKFYLSHHVPGLYMEQLTYISNEFELLLLPGVKFVFHKESRNARGSPVQEFFVLPGDGTIPVGISVPETYEEYSAWSRGLDWEHTPMMSRLNVAMQVFLPPAGGGRKSRHNRGSRKTRRIRGGRAVVAGPRHFNQSRLVQMKRNNQTKKLMSQSNVVNNNPNTVTMSNMSPNTLSNPAVTANNKQNTAIMSNLPTNTHRIPGDRWDTTVPVSYIQRDLTEEEKRIIEHMKTAIARSE